jgi:hypothetical protein
LGLLWCGIEKEKTEQKGKAKRDMMDGDFRQGLGYTVLKYIG